MSPQSKRVHLAAIVVRYRRATKKAKTTILNEFCSTYRCHRKHALRLIHRFRRFSQKDPAKRGRNPSYDPETLLVPLKADLAGGQPALFQAAQGDHPALAAGVYQDLWRYLAGAGRCPASGIACNY